VYAAETHTVRLAGDVLQTLRAGRFASRTAHHGHRASDRDAVCRDHREAGVPSGLDLPRRVLDQHVDVR
jgi:hypothetical protein